MSEFLEMLDLPLKILPIINTILISVNLTLTLREKLKKPRLNMEVIYSAFVRRKEVIDFKIDILLKARNGNVFIQEIFIFNGFVLGSIRIFRNIWVESLSYYPHDRRLTDELCFPDSSSPIKKIPIERVVKTNKLRYSGNIAGNERGVMSNFMDEQWNLLKPEDWEENLTDIKISKDSAFFATVIGEIKIPNYENEEIYLESSKRIPPQNWYICCQNNNDGKVFKKISAETRKL